MNILLLNFDKTKYFNNDIYAKVCSGLKLIIQLK
jgi:hypothetical protein